MHNCTDHAAMVLRYGSEPNEVFIVEASSDGVSIKRWSEINYALGSFYTKVVYRRLKWDRSAESIERLEQFLTETEDANYKFSLQYLTNTRQSMNFEQI